MNARQRVLASINHREPDRLPVDLGATPSSGVSAIAYDNLLGVLPLKNKRNWVYDVVQQVAQPSEEVLDYFSIDTVDLGRTFNQNDSDWYDYRLLNKSIAQQPVWFKPEKQPDGSFLVFKNGEAIAAMPASAFSYDQIVFPFLDGYPARLVPTWTKPWEKCIGQHWHTVPGIMQVRRIFGKNCERMLLNYEQIATGQLSFLPAATSLSGALSCAVWITS